MRGLHVGFVLLPQCLNGCRAFDHPVGYRRERALEVAARDVHGPLLLDRSAQLHGVRIERLHGGEHRPHRCRHTFTGRNHIQPSFAGRFQRLEHRLRGVGLLLEAECQEHQHRRFEHHEQCVYRDDKVPTHGVIEHVHPHAHSLQDMEEHVVHRNERRRSHRHPPVAIRQQKGQ